MGGSEMLTAAQLREAALALGKRGAEQRHRAEAGVLDEDGRQADRDRSDSVRTVQVALEAETARQEAPPSVP
jgi:hypothetical protein